MLKKPSTKTFLIGMLGGVVGTLFGAAIGYWRALSTDPSGWSNLPDALSGAIYGYGLGVGLAAFFLHRKPNAPRAFSRSFLGSLSGLFFIIFFSAPLHLDFFLPLMWGLLILLPPLIAARANNPPAPKNDA
jgi:Ca2+/Na+ antiporter